MTMRPILSVVLLGCVVALAGSASAHDHDLLQLAQVMTEECGDDAVEVLDVSSEETVCAPLPDVSCEEDTELVYRGAWECDAIEAGDPPDEETATRQSGRWIKTGDRKGVDWVHFNIICRQRWQCIPLQDILSERAVHTTPIRWTNGTCMATGGTPKCGTCAANEPEEPCEVWLEGDGPEGEE